MGRPSSDPDFLALSGRFRINQDRLSRKTSSAAIRRTRASLVCGQCRRAKLRCDKKRPCGSCARRDEHHLCRYDQPAEVHDVSTTQPVEQRLLRLESAIQQLLHETTPPPTLAEGKAGEHPLGDRVLPSLITPPPPDHAQRDRDADTYVGGTHWSSILDEIHDIRFAIDGSRASGGPGISSHADALSEEVVFGCADRDTVSDLISQYLPARVQIDRYLAIYFRGESYIIPFIHAHHFQKEYQGFWQNTSAVNPLWLSILFSICYMASLIGGATNSYRSQTAGPPSGDLSLHAAAGKCLVRGRYHQPQKYAVEALAMYGFCKNLRTLDPCREAGTIFSLVIRLAYQMGYHREPRSDGPLSVFECEMRRRCWAAIKQMDLMIAFQLGLPSNIYVENCDAQSPRNLLDSDFDRETLHLPESRPEDQWSKILWFIVKDRQMVGFGNVWRQVLSPQEMPKAEVLRADEQLRSLHATTPPSLRPRPVAEAIADSPFLILTRLYIEFIHLKTLCMLHRKRMARGDPFSVRACLDAGKTIVTLFVDMHKEFSADGQLAGERWMLTNFTVNDFLLGVTVLCLFIYIRHTPSVAAMVGLITDQEVRDLLLQSLTICTTHLTASRDAGRVAKAIQLTLRQVPEQGLTQAAYGARSPKYDDRLPDTNLLNDGSFGLDQSTLLQTSSDDLDHMLQDTSWTMYDPFSFFDGDFKETGWTDMDFEMIL